MLEHQIKQRFDLQDLSKAQVKRLRANFVSKYPDVTVDEAEDEVGDGVSGDKKQKLIFEASLRNGTFETQFHFCFSVF